MIRALLLYVLFFVTHNNFGIDERQYGILRALKHTEQASQIRT